MPFAAALSEHPIAIQAVGEVIGEIVDRLGPPVDLAFFFVTRPHLDAFESIAGAIRNLLRPSVLIGVVASSVVGGDREVEESSGISLWCGRLDAPATPVRIESIHTDEGWVFSDLPYEVDKGDRTLLLVSDPYTFPADTFCDFAAERYPGLTIVGGLASGGTDEGDNQLILGAHTYHDGAVGVLLPNRQIAHTVVSQGCRPIGPPLTVTKADRHIIYEVAGRPALEWLAKVLEALPPDDQRLAQKGIHIGRVIDEHKEDFTQGDFLIRNVLGADREAGAIAVGAEVPVGATVQFQVRDADSATADLVAGLSGHHYTRGALVFTCNGRGTHMFGEADHDAHIVDAVVPRGATAGMFCAGEIGPVGGRSFVHGFTASVVLFRD